MQFNQEIKPRDVCDRGAATPEKLQAKVEMYAEL